MNETLYIATNNGDVSGGEVMMFAVARAARALGVGVSIVAPRSPEGVCIQATAENFDVVRLSADSRPAYIAALARFAAGHRHDWFWCNGLVPSFALTGHSRRINHLHQIPRGVNCLYSRAVSCHNQPALVPSGFAASLIPNSVSFPNWVEAVDSADRMDRQGSRVRLGFMGRLSVLKGTDSLLRAVGSLMRAGAEVETHLAGDYGHIPDEERAMVESALSQLPSERVVWWGRTTPAEFYSGIDALVVPSNCGDAFGLVAAEAMSAHMPLLVSDDGGLPEVVGGEHPWIVPAGDDEALCSGLSDLLEALKTDPERVREATDAAWSRWSRFWSPTAGLERVRDILSNRTALLGD